MSKICTVVSREAVAKHLGPGPENGCGCFLKGQKNAPVFWMAPIGFGFGQVKNAFSTLEKCLEKKKHIEKYREDLRNNPSKDAPKSLHIR